MKKIILLTCALSTSVLAATESPQFFLGMKGGYQQALDDNYNHSSPENAIFGVYSGLQFTPSWSWDVGYQYHDELKADATSVNVRLIESALRYDWYLQDNLSLYSRLGAAYWDMEKTQLSSDKSEATGFSPLAEVGVNYRFTPNVRLSTGYQYVDTIGKSNSGKYDSHELLVALTYTFGAATQPALVEKASTPIVDEIAVKEVVTVKIPHQIQAFATKATDGLFGFDSIKPHDFIGKLTDIASVLNTYPQAQAVVVGYTDSTGSASYNQELFERRAQAVVKLDVTPAQLEWQGEGESQPIADNNTANGRAKNRRVEMTIPSFQL
ncbi:outer membrane beta-barrel protein [Vibrio sp. ZSDZ65]|uniref:Outer membrane beta-barrel protein n=1 Tax=Vibrio qingdaonensis TaxID=2829491 RepID=A0A9X3CPR6_9VIBR|nr:OmpA family protein [Vibrio qingdaonensis]MCW8347343.1 outer membrane beta-barrel protein [Vibrio qingdaonensis]